MQVTAHDANKMPTNLLSELLHAAEVNQICICGTTFAAM